MINEKYKYVVLMIARPKYALNEGDFDLIQRKLAIESFDVVGVPSKTVQVISCTSSIGPKEIVLESRDLSLMLNNLEINVVLEKVFFTPKRLIVFDMDSTLIEQEVIDEISRFSAHHELIASITEKARNGQLDFKEAILRRVALLEGVPTSVFDDVFSRLTLMPGAKQIVAHARKLGMKTALISGGFAPVADKIKDMLGIDFAFSNKIEECDGRLTGKLQGEIVDRSFKEIVLKRLVKDLAIELENTIAVGDGANDLDMINAAGIGIAWRAKPFVQKNSPCRLNSASLEDIRYFVHDVPAENGNVCQSIAQ